jgi:hypothetical protein
MSIFIKFSPARWYNSNNNNAYWNLSRSNALFAFYPVYECVFARHRDSLKKTKNANKTYIGQRGMRIYLP